MPVEVLRIGQRPVRDDRVTTHVALVSRALGASRIFMTEANPEIRGTVQRINEMWGGRFEVTYVDSWRPVLLEKKGGGFIIVHLTMYGESINSVQAGLRRHLRNGRGILVVVGAKKVPRDVYEMADYNVSVGSQPHSEIGSLAVLLDRMYDGRQFEAEFPDARLQIVATGRGKKVVETGVGRRTAVPAEGRGGDACGNNDSGSSSGVGDNSSSGSSSSVGDDGDDYDDTAPDDGQRQQQQQQQQQRRVATD